MPTFPFSWSDWRAILGFIIAVYLVMLLLKHGGDRVLPASLRV